MVIASHIFTFGCLPGVCVENTRLPDRDSKSVRTYAYPPLLSRNERRRISPGINGCHILGAGSVLIFQLLCENYLKTF